MGDLKTNNTSYPTAKDTATLFANLTDEIVAQNHNGPNTAIVAIENELGIGLKGTVADLATRLAVNTGTDGGIVKNTSDPASPGTPAFYYNTVTNKLKIFNPSTGQWDEFTTAAGLASYIRTDVPNTITAVHTFAATTIPFAVTTTPATTSVVLNLNADLIDTQHRVLTIDADHTHTATGAMGGVVSHTSLANIGSNTHAQIDTFISSKGAASGLCPLNVSTKIDASYGGVASSLATLDANAYPVEYPKAPAFGVSLGTGLSGKASGATVKIPFDTEEYDTNNNYDAVTNFRFQPTVPGTYVLSGLVACSCIANFIECLVQIRREGTTLKILNDSFVAGPFIVLPFSCTVHANGSSNYYEIFLYCTTTGGATWGTSAGTYCWWGGSLVSRQ